MPNPLAPRYILVGEGLPPRTYVKPGLGTYCGKDLSVLHGAFLVFLAPFNLASAFSPFSFVRSFVGPNFCYRYPLFHDS